jgi:hypothetical protein
MNITRRQFLLSTAGAAAGAIIPSFYFRALEYFERAGRPLLTAPQRVSGTLSVHGCQGHKLQLFLGDPYAEPPPMSHLEYVDWIGTDPEQYLWEWGLEESALSEPIDDVERCEIWANYDGPAAQAHRLLASLELGGTLVGPDAVGGIELVEECGMVSTWLAARAQDEVSLSLLQKRLTDLGTGIRVVMG